MWRRIKIKYNKIACSVFSETCSKTAASYGDGGERYDGLDSLFLNDSNKSAFVSFHKHDSLQNDKILILSVVKPDPIMTDNPMPMEGSLLDVRNYINCETAKI